MSFSVSGVDARRAAVEAGGLREVWGREEQKEGEAGGAEGAEAAAVEGRAATEGNGAAAAAASAEKEARCLLCGGCSMVLPAVYRHRKEIYMTLRSEKRMQRLDSQRGRKRLKMSTIAAPHKQPCSACVRRCATTNAAAAVAKPQLLQVAIRYPWKTQPHLLRLTKAPSWQNRRELLLLQQSRC